MIPRPEHDDSRPPASPRAENPFAAAAEAALPRMRALRRRLHAHPEVGLHLPETRAAVLESLEGLDLEIATGSSLSSVVAVLRGAKVVFMFQPGEEGFGGGRIMIEEGVLDAAGAPPVAAYAIHVDATTPYGRFVSRRGPVMAGVSALRVRFEGTGGHAAAPHLAVDPVPVAAEAILAVQGFVARRIPAGDPAVVSIGTLASDAQAGNVLAREVRMDANMRYFSDTTLALLRDDLPELLRALGRAHGCATTVEFVPSYPVTVNDPAETARALARLEEVHGEGRVVTMPEPAMASEDFSYVLQRVPGALVFLGARPEDLEPEQAAPMHSEGVRFDDRILGTQAAALADLAWQRLARDAADGPAPRGEDGTA